MLIKFEVDEQLADRMKSQYGQRVASKAFSEAAIDALDLNAEVKHLKYELSQRETEIKVLRQTLEGARSAAARLLESCGQGDMLNDLVPNSSPAASRPASSLAEIGTKTPSADESLEQFRSRLTS